MSMQLEIGDIVMDVVLKDIRNIHLSVYPPHGRVRISAPSRADIDTIRVFAISKLGWIKQQQRKLQEQERETPREYLERESHYIWGKRYLLTLLERDEPPSIELKHNQMFLRVRPGTDEKKKEAIVDAWYRKELRKAVQPLIAKWEPIIGVKVEGLYIQHMKTKWGSCNPQAHHIRINTELAKKPREYLEYIVVHEMVHILEPIHNDRFVSLMNQFMPKWQYFKETLNQLPLKHESWEY
jgi:predicted metal-dependent hydrolase